MFVTPSSRILARCAALLSVSLSLTAAHAHPLVQVRGLARLDADVESPTVSENSRIRGRLRDELGNPISSAKLLVELQASSASSAALTNLTDCDSHGSTSTPQSAALAHTDPEGLFCVSVARPRIAAGYAIRISYEGDDTYAPVATVVTLADQRSGLFVDFEGLAHAVSLDVPEFAFAIALRPMAPSDLRESPALPLQLSLISEDSGRREERKLLRAQVVVGIPAPITLTSTQLDRPGMAELLLTFDGSSVYKPFRTEYRIERISTVQLSVTDWPKSAVAGDRIGITVSAKSGSYVAPPGAVELVGFDGSSSLIPLLPDGTAALSIPTPYVAQRDFLSIKYEPNAPGWRAQPPIQLSLKLLPQSRLKLVGWFAAAFLIIAWFAWSRRRAEPGVSAKAPTAAPRPYAHLEMIEAASDPHADWVGCVVDAHEGTPIAGALIEVRRPGFDSDDLLFTVTSNAYGQFILRNEQLDGEIPRRLELAAKGYARLGLALPPRGRIKVHLVAVRRAILERLVSWTRDRGQPFDSKREPTPDWLAEVARAKGHPEIEAWALAVSRAAFGSHAPVSPESPELLPPSGGGPPKKDAKRKHPLSNG